jgi:hypothetical protein
MIALNVLYDATIVPKNGNLEGIIRTVLLYIDNINGVIKVIKLNRRTKIYIASFMLFAGSLFYPKEVFTIFIVGIVCSYLLYQNVYTMAGRQIIFCSLREGDVAIVISGPDKRNGKFVKLLMNYERHKLEEIGSKAVKGELEIKRMEVVVGRPNLSLLQTIFPGVDLLGLVSGTRHLMEYVFDWSELDEDGNVIHRREPTVRIVVRKIQYAIPMVDLETASTVPVGLILIVTFEIIDPVQAIIVNDQWFNMATNKIKDAVRQLISSFPDPEALTNFLNNNGKIKGVNVEDVIRDAQQRKIDTLGGFLFHILSVYQIDGVSVLESILREQGVKASYIGVTKLDLGAWAKAAQALILAEREGQAKVKSGELSGEAFKQEMAKKVEAWKDMSQALGVDFAALMRYFESVDAARTSPGTTVLQMPNSLAAIEALLKSNSPRRE